MREEDIEIELKDILNSIPYEITIKDLDYNYIYANEKFCKNLNCDFEEIYKKNMSNFWSHKDYEKIREIDKEVIKKNKGIFSEIKLRIINDNERWFYMYKSPFNMNNEKCIITISQEVTLNKKMVNLLEDQIENYSLSTYGYYDIFYDTENRNALLDDNYKNKIKLICKNLCEQLESSNINIYLYDEEQNDLNLYISSHDIDTIEKKNINLGNRRFFKFSGVNLTIDYKMLHKLYGNKKYNVKIYKIKYGSNIIGIMNVYYDKNQNLNVEDKDLINSICYKFGLLFQNKIITRKLKEEENKKIKYRQALEIENLKTEFFLGLSHEIRTPLNIIITSIHSIDDILKTHECERYRDRIIKSLNYIKQNSNRMLRLINNISDVKKLDHMCYDVNYTNCNIVEVIEGIVISVSDYIKVSQRNIIFDTEEEEIIIACDLDKIERIMLNLLSNAIKYSDENTDILVKIRLSEKKDEIIVSVWDDGVAIEKKDSIRIFDKFVQLDKLLNRPCEGTGIGLFLVKSLLEIQGGRVWVNNEVIKGAEIDFSLPVRTVEEKEDKHNITTSPQDKVEIYNVEFSDIYSL
ncbi:sensor histidine kinase [Clostridium butyricum]|uniref:sensor histidine kinase n=3 Tax=Clostridium butyricum TaxID=1492 RepID=UPI0005C1E50A|nr:PAS domain-containing sensor histidine kinase [Clostridium butyricum]KIU06520.1 sensory transduction histidine kinase [Clostridium butyricum]MBA8966360.1 PAS domain S-box-containing protein [Clostridium butyricum]MBA8972575.1 PAS domain S-box-containing protein [Clostridium butyricum]MBC2428414.1 PAS domain-containing protein [Clostridium butyricum]MDU5104046.1 PAS domain-containing sensor histidine kinase [Clostridium butyricum]